MHPAAAILKSERPHASNSCKKGITVQRPINKRGSTIWCFANWQLQQSRRDETCDLQSILNKTKFAPMSPRDANRSSLPAANRSAPEPGSPILNANHPRDAGEVRSATPLSAAIFNANCPRDTSNSSNTQRGMLTCTAFLFQ